MIQISRKYIISFLPSTITIRQLINIMRIMMVTMMASEYRLTLMMMMTTIATAMTLKMVMIVMMMCGIRKIMNKLYAHNYLTNRLMMMPTISLI